MHKQRYIGFTSLLNKIFSIETFVCLYFLVILVFGKSFTKFNIVGTVYLHDFFLFVLVFLAINNRRYVTYRFSSILFIVLIATIYLFYSFLFFEHGTAQLLIVLRHFYLFIYLAISLLLFNLLIKNKHDLFKAVSLIKWISLASVFLQFLFIVIGYFFIPNFSLFGFQEYNYFSPLVIFGIIGYGAYILAYEVNIIKKYLNFIFIIFLSTTLGHSSAFLAVFIILITHFFVKIKPIQRFVALGIIFLAIGSLFFLPQFNDANAGWRVLYWKHVLGRLINEKYFLFGFGFGQPYMTSDYAYYLNDVLNSPIMLDEQYPLARYLSPPHNSFLTIAFHIGLLPMLLLLIPLKKYITQLFSKPISNDRNLNYLTYNLIGSIVWVFFNVILELPHSAVYFWLVYFTTALYYKYNYQNQKK